MPIETDREGYLRNLGDWGQEAAFQIAEAEGIKLTADHWQVIEFLREFYQTYQIIPSMRVLVKTLGQRMDPEKANSHYLQSLFPGGIIKQGCKLAGLPKPNRCI